jgi:DNA-binding beta-propeller fold protein YncE
MFFKPDGTKVYVTGQSSDVVGEYNLSTAWDISTMSHNQNFSVASQEATAAGICFKDDGTKMYVTGYTGDDVNEYDLSTAWDVSTASYSQNFSVSGQETAPRGIVFKTDGTKMYIAGSTGDDVNEYDLSTAWDVSTATFNQNFRENVVPEGQLTDVFFKPDGTRFWITGRLWDRVYQYDIRSS